MRIEFLDVRFKNFLSYGNNWNYLKFDNNINFVISGNKFRSNTMGKSSCLRTVSFALFGKVVDISKVDLINWQNGKNCVVELTFKKGENVYTIKRGLKPNFLEILVNDVPQSQDSDLRGAQRKLEEEILEINFDLFNNLIYCNSNNTISILNTTAIKKRQFIESLFSDMEYFSGLMEKTKEKLKKIKSLMEKNNLRIENINLNIDETSLELSKLIVPDIDKEFEDFQKIEFEYNKLLDENRNVDSNFNKIEKEIKENNTLYDNHGYSIKKIENENWKFSEKLKVLQEQIKDCENTSTLEEELLKANSYLEKHCNINDTLKKLESHIKTITEKLNLIKDIKTECQIKINIIKSNLKDLVPDESLKDKTLCPLCKGSINFSNLESHLAEEKSRLRSQIDLISIEMEKDEELFSRTNNILNKMYYTKGKLKEILNKCNDYNNKKQYLEMSIEDGKKFNFKELSKEIKKTEKNIEKQEKEKKNLDFKQTQLSLVIDELNFNYKLIKDKFDNIKFLEKELELKKLSYKNNEEKKEDIIKRRLNKQEKIKNYNTEKEKLFSSNKKLYDLQDYFDVLKEALKDDNIKSHVINILIPFLNQKVNEYLAEIGFDFFVEFDNYMDITISGPGSRYNCKLGSMSGAESKCIDLVTRFALMDLVKIKSKVYPDLLILDELLDSSVDQHGIEKIMNVIRYIQERNNLKVFIVSHRSELNDFPYGKTYKINKDKKFSYIEA